MKNHKTPLYLQIYKELEEYIKADIYKENELLPSESALQKQFNVSKITIRRALQDLELSGYIKIRKGKGSIILPKSKNLELIGITSFSQEVLKIGESPSSIILLFEEIEPSLDIKKSLNLTHGDMIYHLKRLRLKNGRIIGLNDQFISKKYGIVIDKNQLTDKTSIYQLYEQQGFKIAKATEIIEAKMPTLNLIKEMYLEKNIPIFKRERITYDEQNRPLEVSKNYYKSDEYKYIITLKKEDNY